MAIILVNNASALLTALARAKGGDTIELAPGNYTSVYVKSINPASNVTITSADGADPAVLSSLTIFNSSNLTLDGVEVHNVLNEGKPSWTPMITVNASRNITLRNLDVHGSLDGNASNDMYGIRVQNSNGVSITDSDFHQLFRSAVFSNTDNIIVARNDVTETREGFDFSATDHVLIEGNYFHQLKPDASKGDHPDAIQFSTSNIGGSSHIVIRDNAIISGETTAVQGIFMRSTDAEFRYSDVLIENNLYYGGSRHAITVSSVDGITITGNTVVASTNPALIPGITVNGSTGETIVQNISPLYIDDNKAAVIDPSNIVVRTSKSPYGVPLEQLFTAPPTDPLTATVANFVVKSGSLAAALGAGFATIAGIGGPAGTIGHDTTAAGAETFAGFADESADDVAAIFDEVFAGEADAGPVYLGEPLIAAAGIADQMFVAFFV